MERLRVWSGAVIQGRWFGGVRGVLFLLCFSCIYVRREVRGCGEYIRCDFEFVCWRGLCWLVMCFDFEGKDVSEIGCMM